MACHVQATSCKDAKRASKVVAPFFDALSSTWSFAMSPLHLYSNESEHEICTSMTTPANNVRNHLLAQLSRVRSPMYFVHIACITRRCLMHNLQTLERLNVMLRR